MSVLLVPSRLERETPVENTSLHRVGCWLTLALALWCSVSVTSPVTVAMRLVCLLALCGPDCSRPRDLLVLACLVLTLQPSAPGLGIVISSGKEFIHGPDPSNPVFEDGPRLWLLYYGHFPTS